MVIVSHRQYQTEDGCYQQVLDHLAEIAVEPTPVGSEQHKQVRDYLVNVLSELGLNQKYNQLMQ